MPDKDFIKASADQSLAQAILESTPNGIFALSRIEKENDYRIDYCNEFACTLFNKTQVDFIGKSISSLFPNFYTRGFDKIYNQVYLTGLPYTLEYFSSARSRWFRLSLAKTETGIILIYTDIQEKKSADDELRRQKDLLEEVINSSLSLIMTFKCFPDEESCTDFICLLSNNTADKILGKGKSLSGKLVSKFFPEFSHYFQTFKEAAINETTVNETIALSINNQELFYTLVANKTNEGIFISLRDITHQKTTELELVRKTEELQKSNLQLVQFASIVSHDLKEPLRKIRTFSDLLQKSLENKITEKESDYLTHVLKSSSRMQLLIEDLLKYSTLQLSPAINESCDLQLVIDDVLDDLEIIVRQSDTKITVSDMPVIKANESRMRQLFSNLIHNAIKFRSKNRRCSIKITHKEIERTGQAFHSISLEDNGIGFEQKYADKIFSIFQRLHGKDEYEGTGIGLAICKMIAEQHHGTIQVYSEPGKGTRFEIQLPRLA